MKNQEEYKPPVIRVHDYTKTVKMIETSDYVLLGFISKILGFKKMIKRELTEPENKAINEIIEELKVNNK